MKVSIIGPGDLTKIIRHTKLTQKDLQKLIENIAKLLVRKKAEVIVTLDSGIPLEIAMLYKKLGGKKVYGMIPTNDKRYGIEHIRPYIDLADEKIKVNDWYDVNGEIAAAGDLCICLGMSPGISIELSFLKYHHKYLKNKTKLIIFKNTLSKLLHKEITEELNFEYIDSLKELEKFF
jgi:hypothetical protein